ncbi:hypothetical protein PGT21_009582 [Puccinia graminis f. sp. tritici]|uniref:Uncharacterized protein n=1 Tax=Puccinia graminis f. sp. tritici TaxID=56615 RepID=A0A5B0RV28_PUCGR|nr:hypothetical protein PGT21_009582 [Puccinia graminis f. sp. tritici]KAA1129457.1 hypothetical protein PGTUg99_008109 [Puccinia graminis f. sp. tritici]
MISLDDLQRIGSEFFGSKQSDFEHFLSELKMRSGETMKLSELLQSLHDWLHTTKGGLPELLPLDGSRERLIQQLVPHFNQVYLDKFLIKIPQKQRKPFQEFAMQRLKTQGKLSPGDIWEGRKAEELYEEWKKSSLWIRVQVWWDNLLARSSVFFKKLFGRFKKDPN